MNNISKSKNRPTYTFLLMIFCLIVMVSCTSNYSRYKGEAIINDNQVTTYNEPVFQKDINAVGWTVNIGISASVGMGAYYYLPVSPAKDLFSKMDVTLSDNSIKIGQGLSLGIITYFINKAIMNDQTKSIVDESNVDLWLKGINKDLINVEFKKSQFISAIDKDDDKKFVMMNINDAKLFKRIFPKSAFTEEKISKVYPKLKNFELNELISIYPDLNISDIIRKKLILESEYLKDFIVNANKNKDALNNIAPIEIENKLDKLIKSFEDISSLKTQTDFNYPKDYLENKAISYIKILTDIDRFNKTFPNHNKQEKIEEIGFSFINKTSDAIEFLKYNPIINNYDKFENLAFSKVNTLMDLKQFKEKIQKNISFDNSKELVSKLIKNADDLIYLNKLYPNDKIINDGIDKIFNELDINGIAKIIEAIPFIERKDKLYNRFISLIKNIDDAVNAHEKFPEKTNEISEIAYKYLSNINDYRKFLTHFDVSKHYKEIKNKYTSLINIEPENLGNKINSKFAEYCPNISPDGETLFFVRRDKENPKENEDIYFSNLDAVDIWGTSKNIGPPLNNTGHNAVNGVSQDGNTLLLHNLYQTVGTGLSMSYKTKNGWSNPIDLNIPDFYNDSKYHNACYSVNEHTILVSAKRKDGLGGNDIYVVNKDKNGLWQSPVNIGKNINSSEEESSVFLAADNVTIYFSSNGHGGFGGYDIFMSRRLDNTWTKWSNPENLGPKINTALDEQFYVIPASGDFVYFSSDNNSIGQSDLFRIGLPEDMRPYPVVLVTGRILNKKTDEPIAGNVIYEDISTGEELGSVKSDEETGEYKLILPKGTKYGIRGEANGFYAVNENLDLTGLENYKQVTVDLKMVPILKGEIANINNIFFDFAKYDLKSESFLELDRIIKMLKDYPDVNLQISGHTDIVGTDQRNQKLSENRAKSVVDYLTSKGIDSKRLKSVGYGATMPVVPNDSDFNRAKNRRVELKFM